MILVVGVLITRGRQEMAAAALRCFLSQTYQAKTLVIIDDSEDRSFPEGVTHPSVRYEISPERNIPAKRNMAAAMATESSIIIHFDSDDYSAPDRIADQVFRLQEAGKQVTGYCSMLFYEEHSGRAARYIGRAADYALGTSLCFAKSFWESHRFNESLPTGEDNAFVKTAVYADQFVGVGAGSMMVARIHEGNTSPKDLGKLEYRPVDRSALPEAFFL